MKKVRKIVLCGLILIAGVFNKYVYADGIEDIRKEFCKASGGYTYNDGVVDECDRDICNKYGVSMIGEAPWKVVLEGYISLFKTKRGNCRVASAYFSKKFDESGIENRELNVVYGQGCMHSSNLYKLGNEWYVADFIMAVKHHKKAKTYFDIPLRDYILKGLGAAEGTKALAFGVYNKENRGGKDLGDFIPELNSFLAENNFMIYVGPRSDEPIRVVPRRILDFDEDAFMMRILSQMPLGDL